MREREREREGERERVRERERERESFVGTLKFTCFLILALVNIKWLKNIFYFSVGRGVFFHEN